MNFFSKNRFVFWLLIFLVVIVLTSFITFIVFISNKTTTTSQQSSENTGNSFKKELSLSPAQSEKVQAILADYKNVTEPVVADIRDHRLKILDELAKNKPDKAVLNGYVDEIATLQKQMQSASVSQYLALKEICSPVQCQRLSTLYYELYGCQGQSDCQGKGRRYRGGRGDYGR